MDDYLANPKVYGDVEHDGWTAEEEEDYEPNGKEETSSDEDEATLPQPGDMHIISRSPVSLRELIVLITDLFLLVFSRKVKEIYVTRS